MHRTTPGNIVYCWLLYRPTYRSARFTSLAFIGLASKHLIRKCASVSASLYSMRCGFDAKCHCAATAHVRSSDCNLLLFHNCRSCLNWTDLAVWRAWWRSVAHCCRHLRRHSTLSRAGGAHLRLQDLIGHSRVRHLGRHWRMREAMLEQAHVHRVLAWHLPLRRPVSVIAHHLCLRDS